MGNRYHPLDANLLFCEDKTLAASDIVADGGGADVILNLGDGRMDGDLVVDIETLEVDTGNENFQFVLQGSNSASFASGIVNLCQIEVGDSSTLPGSVSADSPVGRYSRGFSTDFLGTNYKYVRLNVLIAGTQAVGVKFSSWLAPRQ